MTTTQTDITPAWHGYTGPRISFTWHDSVGVARTDGDRCESWVLVPADLLRHLARLADGTGLGRSAWDLLTPFALEPSDDPSLDCAEHGFVYAIGSAGCPDCREAADAQAATGTLTDAGRDQQAIYDSLTGDTWAAIQRGGPIPADTGLRCDYCEKPAVFAAWAIAALRLACSHAVHIAWVSSVGSACPVSAIVPGDGSEGPEGEINGCPVVDPSTVVPPAPCGCPVYAETDGTFTTRHNCATQAGHYHVAAVQDLGGSQEYGTSWSEPRTREQAEAHARDVVRADTLYTTDPDYRAKGAAEFGERFYDLISSNVAPGFDAVYIVPCGQDPCEIGAVCPADLYPLRPWWTRPGRPLHAV